MTESWTTADLAFFWLALLASLFAIGSAAATTALSWMRRRAMTAVAIVCALEIVCAIAAPVLGFARVREITTMFGASGMEALLLTPLLRAWALLASAMGAANIGMIALLRTKQTS
jgi:hypothetical protein